MTENKWATSDKIKILAEFLIPVGAIVSTHIITMPSYVVSISIISLGILIPIIMLQSSVIVGQKNTENDIRELKNEVIVGQKNTENDIRELKDEVKEISKKINNINPILERVFLSDNDKAKRFAYRRMKETTKLLDEALSRNDSGNLNPSEYYIELLYIADLITEDYEKQKNNFQGEIWAMTSFAEEEWIEDVGYERLWTAKLSSMVKLGIKTRRICVIPDSIYELISEETFSEKASKEVKSFHGFVNYLATYYGSKSIDNADTAEHYFIRTHHAPNLTEIKGFFAIKLNSGGSHILHGETVNENGALTAKVLFDQKEIDTIHNLFNLHATNDMELSKNLIKISEKNGFINYLRNKGIKFN